MAQTHSVKCWPVYFQAVVERRKPFEVRLNDRDYRTGDDLVLREWSPDTEEYSGRETRRTITYVMPGGQFGVQPNFVVLGLQ